MFDDDTEACEIMELRTERDDWQRRAETAEARLAKAVQTVKDVHIFLGWVKTLEGPLPRVRVNTLTNKVHEMRKELAAAISFLSELEAAPLTSREGHTGMVNEAGGDDAAESERLTQHAIAWRKEYQAWTDAKLTGIQADHLEDAFRQCVEEWIGETRQKPIFSPTDILNDALNILKAPDRAESGDA